MTLMCLILFHSKALIIRTDFEIKLCIQWVHSQLNSRANLSPWPVAKYIGLLCFTTDWVFIAWSFVPEDELQQWNMKVSDVNIVVVRSEADNKGHNVQLVMERIFLLVADRSLRESPCFTVWHRCSVGKHSLFPEGKNQVPLKFTVIQMLNHCQTSANFGGPFRMCNPDNFQLHLDAVLAVHWEWFQLHTHVQMQKLNCNLSVQVCFSFSD